MRSVSLTGALCRLPAGGCNESGRKMPFSNSHKSPLWVGGWPGVGEGQDLDIA